MKKLLFSMMVLSLAAAACQVESTSEQTSYGEGPVFTATIADECCTRTTLKGMTPVWNVGDEASINGYIYCAIPLADNTRKATFVAKYPKSGYPFAPYVAWYPASIYDAETNTTTLPSVQKYGDFSLNPMVAVSGNPELNFKNVCAVLAIKVKSSDIVLIKSIRVSSSNCATCGEFTIEKTKDGYKAVLKTPEDVEQAVVLDCGEGVKTSEEGTVFHVAIPAQVYKSLKIEFSEDGETYTKEMTTKGEEGKEVFENKIYNITFKTDAGLRFLLGKEGTKIWKWDYNASTGSTCWGNGGASVGSDYTNARTAGNHWWGVKTPDELMNSLQYAGGTATGAEDNDAYMVFDKDGNITSYKSSGGVIASGSYSLDDYDATRSSGWEIASLKDPQSAVLFPFIHSQEGGKVTDFDVMYLDANHMTLVYTNGNEPGSYGEITHWMFKNASSAPDAFNGGSQRKWGWASDGYEIWGNAGNTGNGENFKWNCVDGKWWGVKDASDLLGELDHSDTGEATGEEDNNAYMIFDTEGNVKSYDASGNVIRSGSYELEMYPEGRKDGWELGKLKVTEGSMLFPFRINGGGAKPTEFDIMYIDADNMTLVYTNGSEQGSWSEVTYWRFEAKQ